jgi:uncharacterized protein
MHGRAWGGARPVHRDGSKASDVRHGRRQGHECTLSSRQQKHPHPLWSRPHRRGQVFCGTPAGAASSASDAPQLVRSSTHARHALSGMRRHVCSALAACPHTCASQCTASGWSCAAPLCAHAACKNHISARAWSLDRALRGTAACSVAVHIACAASHLGSRPPAHRPGSSACPHCNTRTNQPAKHLRFHAVAGGAGGGPRVPSSALDCYRGVPRLHRSVRIAPRAAIDTSLLRLQAAPEAGRAFPAVPWDWGRVVTVMAAWFAVFIVLSGHAATALPRLLRINPESLTSTGHAVGYFVCDLINLTLTLSLIRLALRPHRLWRSGLFALRPTRGVLKWVFLASLTFPAVDALSHATQSLFLFPPDVLAEHLEESLTAGDVLANGIYFLVVSICTPIWEEAIFRGFLLTSLARYWRPAWAVVASSAVFAVAHCSLYRMPCAPSPFSWRASVLCWCLVSAPCELVSEATQPLPHAVRVPRFQRYCQLLNQLAPARRYLFLLGCVIGAVFARTRSLAAPVAVHALWNAYVLAKLALHPAAQHAAIVTLVG